jgi:hypothetical protein
VPVVGVDTVGDPDELGKPRNLHALLIQHFRFVLFDPVQFGVDGIHQRFGGSGVLGYDVVGCR